jgi:hypothetical protein
MTRSDALAIKAYLFSLKPIKYSPPSNNMSFPFDQRYLMVWAYFTGQRASRLIPEQPRAGSYEPRR